ncbi:MAG TPA: alginate export family protein, partial [Candidatus Hydrogenedentes bacterium]|nr:alginate export family protein [Candidatus Hydrogenedentota bacterium]
MRSKRNVWLGMFGAALSFLIVGAAQAELQNVEVGGEIRTRGRWYINTFNPGNQRQVRMPNNALWGRPIGGNGVSSGFKWNEKGADWSRLESSVLLNVKADFTQNVSAFFELYDFFIWGEDFRSQNYITGQDIRANSADDIEINQAYIEVKKIWDSPISVRIGRQALKFGKGWLVSDMLTPSQYVSHDAVRLTFQMSDFTVDAVASRVVPMMQDPFDDVSFYGIYGTWAGFKPLSVSAYYFLLHDPRNPENVQGSRIAEHVERLLNLDKYGDTYLHTVGIRLFGGYEGFDYDLELAYQFGRADSLGATFRPVGKLYGDQDLKYNNWGVEATIGYTFREVLLKPRPFIMAVLYSGEDNRDISFV